MSIGKISDVDILRSFGVGEFIIRTFEKRMEVFLCSGPYAYEFSQSFYFIKLIMQVAPAYKTIKRRRLVNVYILDIISSYRG